MKFFGKKKENQSYVQRLQLIGRDFIFLYKNIIHFILSKLCVSVASILLGVIFFIPAFFISAIVMWLDPISWGQIIYFVLSGGDMSIELISNLASHPYWIIFDIFLLTISFLIFLLFSLYSHFLLSRVALKYIDKKKLEVRKNVYFSKNHISSYVSIMLWMGTMLLAPIMILVGVVFFLYLFFNMGYISAGAFDVIAYIVTTIFIVAFSYLLYRIIFAYVILADSKKKKHFDSARSYVNQSVALTAGNNIWKFLPVIIIYILFVSPFYWISANVATQQDELRIAYVYKSSSLDSVDQEELQYYEYITAKYSDTSAEEIYKKIGKNKWASFFIGVFGYLFISGTLVMLLTSFYRRILLQK